MPQLKPYIILKKADRLIKNDDKFLSGLHPQNLNTKQQERTEEVCSPGWDPQLISDLDNSLRYMLDQYKDKNLKRNQSDIDFAILIHTIFFHLPRRIAALEGFWHELTLTSSICEEYVRWRWAKNSHSRLDSNDPADEDSIIHSDTDEINTTVNNTIIHLIPKVRFTGDLKRNALSRLWWAAEVTCQRDEMEDERYEYTRRGLVNSDVMQYIVDVDPFTIAQLKGPNSNDIRLWKYLIEAFEALRDQNGKEDSIGLYKLSGSGFVAIASELGRVLVTMEISILSDEELAALVKKTAEDAIKRQGPTSSKNLLITINRQTSVTP